MNRNLFFKLNDDNEKHNLILSFFDNMKRKGINKVDVLYYLCQMNLAAQSIVRVKKGKEKELLKKLENDSVNWEPVISNIEHNHKSLSGG